MRAHLPSLALGAALAVGSLLLTPSAEAQSASDKAAAESLFDLGKKLASQKDWNAACPKFAESLRLDSGIGTMLHLADCYEQIGKTASAWAQFREAAAVASRQGDKREKIARDRASRLEPKLSKLSITVPMPIEGLTLTRDGETIAQALWGTAIPVDPGSHAIVASAPGKKSWENQTEVGPSGAQVEVAIPTLEDAPVEAVASPSHTPSTSPEAPPPATGRGDTQRWAGIATAGVGVVGVGLGAAFGLMAKSSLAASNADGHCRAGNLCDAQGVESRSDAKTQATVSTVGFIAGGVLLAGGAVLYFTAPKQPASVGVTAAFGPDTAGLVAAGRF